MTGITYKVTADRMGVFLDDLDELLKGRATARVATRLGVFVSDVEDFIKGTASQNMTRRLGLPAISAAEELARAHGREGAIGIVIGLMLSP